MIKEYILRRDGLKIYANAYIPDGDKQKCPAVIMSSGFNGKYTGNIKYAVGLQKAGIVSVIFDFCGGAMDSKSDGKMIDMTVLTEKADLNCVIDFTKTLNCTDDKNIFLMGKSQGGFVSAMAASERDDIRGLILLYPGFAIPDTVRSISKRLKPIPEYIEILGGIAGRKYCEDALKINTDEIINRYKGSVIILHGDNDDVVPIKYSKNVSQRYKNAELKIFHGAGHGFKDNDVFKACKYIKDFIDYNLAGETNEH